MILQDGPLEGYEIPDIDGYWNRQIPAVDGDGSHFVSHLYRHDGTWLHSETFVGFESDETIARNLAMDLEDYWNEVESNTDESFV